MSAAGFKHIHSPSHYGSKHGTAGTHFAVGKNTGSSGAGKRRSPAEVGTQNNSSILPRLRRQELIRKTQAIVLPFSIKETAIEQDTTNKAVEQQRAGESAMSLLAAVNMSRSNPRARAMFAELFGFTGAVTDPDFMEFMSKGADWFARQNLHAEEIEEAAEGHADLFETEGEA